MATSAQYVATPKSPTAAISAANTNRDGATGTYVNLMTAGASGSRIDRLNITATGTTTAGMIRFFLAGALIREVPVVAITAAATTPIFSYDLVFDNGLILAASAVLKVSTNNAEAFNVTVLSGGDF